MMEFELRFTAKEIPAWGGMGLMKRMLEPLGFEAALAAAGLAQPGSNRGYRPRQLITQFMRSVWCGANRFEQGEVKRHDPVLKSLFGFKRMTYFKAVMRLFNTFTQGTNESVMDSLYRWMYGQLSINAWSKPRWVVGIRQHIERRAAPKGKTLNLFADDPVTGQWRFSARVTDLDLPAEAIWRIYRGRADCENRIKELKYDFAADSLNMKAFGATEARLNTVLLAYNLMSLLRQVLLKTGAVKPSSTSVQHRLKMLRYKRFAKPAYITTDRRKPILNLALAMRQRTDSGPMGCVKNL